MNWLADKKILITGASNGIGKELTLRLSSICSSLHLVALNRTGDLDSLHHELTSARANCYFYQGNINDQTFATNCISLATKDGLDAFVHCAGGTDHYGLFESWELNEITNVINTNVVAPLVWLRLLLPHLSKKNNRTKSSHVVLMSSRSGERTLPGLCPYAVAKGAVEKIADALQKEYARQRIAFSLINPGSIDTKFVTNWNNQNAADAHTKESMTVYEVVPFIIQILDSECVVNKISLESMEQWTRELGVLPSGNA